MGIQLASKCDCCRDGGYGDVNHVLFAGDFSLKIFGMSAACMSILATFDILPGKIIFIIGFVEQ